MFETEEQLEKTSSGSSARFLVILLVIILVGAGVVYFIVKSQKPLSPEQATVVLGEILKAKGPAIVHFHVGTVPSVDEKPRDPHYTLLEKAGYLKLMKMAGGGTRVEVTPLGTDTSSRIPEFRKMKNPDGTDGYIVPLSERKLVAVNSVTMATPSAATVEYTWKWGPNKVGDDFDASGKLAQSFSSWDRATLIQKYGVDFYHAAPQKATINLVRSDKGWKVATD